MISFTCIEKMDMRPFYAFSSSLFWIFIVLGLSFWLGNSKLYVQTQCFNLPELIITPHFLQILVDVMTL